jgi:heme/copper-type cytochrome/quinol oxidase subunit 1
MSIVGFDIDTKSHYTPSTTITAIPTGIKILNWFISQRLSTAREV